MALWECNKKELYHCDKTIEAPNINEAWRGMCYGCKNEGLCSPIEVRAPEHVQNDIADLSDVEDLIGHFTDQLLSEYVLCNPRIIGRYRKENGIPPAKLIDSPYNTRMRLERILLKRGVCCEQIGA